MLAAFWAYNGSMATTDDILRAGAALAAGGAVVFPTDTVYGVGVAVGPAKTPAELFRIKRRDEGKRNHAAHQKRHVARGAGRQQDQRHERQRHNHGDHCHRARPQPGAKPCHPSAARTSAARIPTRAHRTEYPWPRCVTSQSTTPIFSRA